MLGLLLTFHNPSCILEVEGMASRGGVLMVKETILLLLIILGSSIACFFLSGIVASVMYDFNSTVQTDIGMYLRWFLGGLIFGLFGFAIGYLPYVYFVKRSIRNIEHAFFVYYLPGISLGLGIGILYFIVSIVIFIGFALLSGM